MQIEDKIVYSSSLFHIGRFRCPSYAPVWREENCNGIYPIFVFPRVPVEIRQAGYDSVLATPNNVMLYNPLQPYTRRAVDPRGDHCEYIGINTSTIYAAQSAKTLEGDPYQPPRPFRRSHIPCTSQLYLAQRLLFKLASSSESTSSLELDSAFMNILPTLLDSVSRTGNDVESSAKRRSQSRNRELALAAQEYISRNHRRQISLEDVASYVDCSVYHLCRVFKQNTSHSVYSYIKKMRLLSSIEQVIETRIPFTQIALEFQFSSHSHFTNAFRKAFGLTPGQLRTSPNRSKLDFLAREI